MEQDRKNRLDRDYMVDNYKGFMIILVVVAHFSHHFTSDYQTLVSLRNFIYFVNMPAFAFLSGYLFKGKNNLGKMIKGLVIPYTVFQLVYWIMYNAMGYDIDFTYMKPFFSLWYLPALFIWKWVLGFLKDHRRLLFGFFLIFGIGAGYLPFDSGLLSLQRVISFFPFFILGYMLDKVTYQKYRGRKCIHLLALAGIILAWYLGSEHRKIFCIDLLNCDVSYFELHMVHDGWFYRLSFYAISTLLVLTFGLIISRRKTIFTSLGRNSMRVYLLHGVIYRYLVFGDLRLFDLVHGPKTLAIYYVAVLAMCFGLSMIPIEKGFTLIYNLGHKILLDFHQNYTKVSHWMPSK